MADNNVRRFPVDGDERWRNINGPLAVGCQVSSLWLQFDEFFDPLRLGDVVRVDVMVQSESGKVRRVRQLVLRLEDLHKALAHIKERPAESGP